MCSAAPASFTDQAHVRLLELGKPIRSGVKVACLSKLSAVLETFFRYCHVPLSCVEEMSAVCSCLPVHSRACGMQCTSSSERDDASSLQLMIRTTMPAITSAHEPPAAERLLARGHAGSMGAGDAQVSRSSHSSWCSRAARCLAACTQCTCSCCRTLHSTSWPMQVQPSLLCICHAHLPR